MYLFKSNDSKVGSIIIHGVLAELGFKYTSQNSEEPPTLTIYSAQHRDQLLGHHLDDRATREFVRNCPADTRVYSGSDEIDAFLTDVLAANNPKVTLDQRRELLQDAKSKVAITMLSIMMQSALGNGLAFTGTCKCSNDEAVVIKPKKAKTAAGFDKTKASKLASKSVRIGKIPLARRKS